MSHTPGPCAEILAELKDLVSIVEAMDLRQHAGLEIPASDWGEVHQACASARAAIARAEGR